jgi:hypothetical protein
MTINGDGAPVRVIIRQGVFAMGRNFGFKIDVPLNFNW